MNKAIPLKSILIFIFGVFFMGGCVYVYQLQKESLFLFLS